MIKKIFDHKVFYVIVSIIIAVLFWVYVDWVTNDSMSKTFTNIPVTFEGEDTLEARGLMIVHDDGGEVVTLRLSGKRSDMMKLDRDNIEITVRTSQIVSAGVQELEYTISYPRSVTESGITVLSRSMDTVPVEVVAEATKTVSIQTEFIGTVAEGYYFETMACSPEQITISGPQELVDQVSYALVTVGDVGISSTTTADYSFKLMDENKNEVSQEGLTCSSSMITVVLKVNAQKTVPLTVTFLPGGGATEENVTCNIDPQSITISGDDSQLADITSIDLGEIDLSQIFESTTVTRDITLRDGLGNLSGITQATVEVTISGLTTQNFDANNFVFLNQPEGTVAEMVTGNLNVTLRGSYQAMSEVTSDNITVAADLSGVSTLSSGTITVPATVLVNGVDDMGAIGSYSVVVRIG
jgi:YbbR domain-containing protein